MDKTADFARLADSDFWGAVRAHLEDRIEALDRISLMPEGLAVSEYVAEAMGRAGAAVILRELIDEIDGARDSLIAAQPEREDPEPMVTREE